jgi:hypothetical protein
MRNFKNNACQRFKAAALNQYLRQKRSEGGQPVDGLTPALFFSLGKNATKVREQPIYTMEIGSWRVDLTISLLLESSSILCFALPRP